jgi:S1-C subfamily serine protease
MKKLFALALALAAVGSAAMAADEYPAVAVVEQVQDSVVSIDANQVTFGVALGAGDEVARQQRLLTNTLTGFVYTADGYIITDSQEIESAVLLNVVFADGSELEGKVVGVDEEYGIGVIKVEPKTPLKPVKMLDKLYEPKKDSYPYAQGDPIIAIGSSAGFGGTVTTGIIGAIRNFRNENGILVPNMIQADVVINAGNEGSPLFNNNGEVIAFHDRRSDGGRMQNTTFFTPIWFVRRIADEIIKNHEDEIEDPEIWHPWLGIKPFAGSTGILSGDFGGIRTVGDDLKMFLDIPDQYWDVGVLIDTVFQESPAKEFGLRDKDMLLEVQVLHGDNDVNREKGIVEEEKHPRQFIKRIEDLELMVTTADRGDIFIFGVLRAKSYFNVEVVIGQHPGAFIFTLPAGQFVDLEVSNDYF